jgi:hypothetical protein
MNQRNTANELSTEMFTYDKRLSTFTAEITDVQDRNLRDLTLNDLFLRSKRTGVVLKFTLHGPVVDGEGDVKYWLWSNDALRLLVIIYND